MQCNNKHIASVILLFCLLLSVNVYTLLFADSIFGNFTDRIWYVLVVAIGYLIGLSLLRLRAFFIISGVAQMIVLPIEVSCLFLNGQPVSMPYMYWILSTNRTEAGELLSSIWWFALIVFFVWALYGWLVTRVPNEKIIKGRNQWWAWPIVFALGVVLCFIHYSTLKKTYTAPSKRVYMQIYAWSFGMRIGKVFPYDIYLQTFRSYKHQQEIDGLAALSDYHFGITHRAESDSAIYVLVIGEAARYQNFSLNGIYPRATNPLLSHQSNIVLYTRAYAEANATDLSVPLMLTRATAENPLQAYKEKTVAGAFQEAGHKAIWLSADNAPIGYLQHIFPSMDTTWIASDEVMDGALLKPFEEIISKQDNNQSSLFVLHTKGSHLNYQDRYPDQYAQFQPCLTAKSTNISFDKELMTNTYDNTILYTDFFLHSLIQTLEATHRCACLIYMPDHGENLCDDERKLWVHGTYDGSEWEYHVPLIVWYSNRFMEQYPQKVHALTANRDKQVTAQVLFYTLCDLANLTEVVDSRHSLLSDSLEENQVIRVLNGKGELINLGL